MKVGTFSCLQHFQQTSCCSTLGLSIPGESQVITNDCVWLMLTLRAEVWSGRGAGQVRKTSEVNRRRPFSLEKKPGRCA